MNKNFSALNEGGGGSSSSSSTGKFPILSYDATAVSMYVNGELDGVTFVGIAVPKDTCVAFCDTVAGRLNDMAFYNAMGIKSPAGMIYELIATLSAVTGSALATAIANAIASITEYFAGLWKGLVALITSKDVISIVIGAIILLVGAVCIAIMAKMFVYGFLRKGFATGWKVRGFLSWNWYDGEIA